MLEQVERLMDDAGYARLEQYLSLRRLSLVGATLDSWLRCSVPLQLAQPERNALVCHRLRRPMPKRWAGAGTHMPSLRSYV